MQSPFQWYPCPASFWHLSENYIIGYEKPVLKTHSERVTKACKTLVNDLGYEGIEFPLSRKDYSKIEHKKVFINVFRYENDLVYSVYGSNKQFTDCMDLLLIADEYKLHNLYIKDFNKFMCNKTKNKNRKHLFK